MKKDSVKERNSVGDTGGKGGTVPKGERRGKSGKVGLNGCSYHRNQTHTHLTGSSAMEEGEVVTSHRFRCVNLA